MDEVKCPLSRQVLRNWKRFVMANPWRGDKPLLDRRYFQDTTAITEPGRPLRILMSFDIGYHSSGWFANSEWEQNLHLSFSYPRTDKPSIILPTSVAGVKPHQMGTQLETVSDDEARVWGEIIYGKEDSKMAWFEAAAGVFDPYRNPNVVHLRLFHDENGQPFMPKGEPYKLKPWADGSSPEKVFGRNRAT